MGKKALKRQGSSKALAGTPSSTTSKANKEINLDDLLSDLSPTSSKASSGKKSSKKKAAEERRKAEAALRLAELQRQEEEAEQQLKSTLALQDEILERAVRAASLANSAVAAGFRHSSAVQADGRLLCFGTSGRGQCHLPAELGPATAVAAGNLHTCAIQADGTLQCFGDDSFSQCRVPATLGAVACVAAGFGHTCAVDQQGQLHCFGDNYYGQCTIPEELKECGRCKAVAAGFRHTCVITTESRLVCFGDNGCGQCDIPADLGPVRLVAAGDFHTCAVTSTGRLHCFGSNASGQCDDPKRLQEVIAVTAGSNYTIALSLEGKISCFGASGHGQCDLPEELQFLFPQEPEDLDELSSPSLGLEAADLPPEDLQETENPDLDALLAEDAAYPPEAEQFGMASTMDSFAESFTTMDTSASEYQEAEPLEKNAEEQAQARIQALHLQVAEAWELVTAMAQRFADKVRGLSAGSFHCCIILADGHAVFFGDDSANQCTVPDGFVPLIPQLTNSELPLAVLDTGKPAILLPPTSEEDSLAVTAAAEA